MTPLEHIFRMPFFQMPGETIHPYYSLLPMNYQQNYSEELNRMYQPLLPLPMMPIPELISPVPSILPYYLNNIYQPQPPTLFREENYLSLSEQRKPEDNNVFTIYNTSSCDNQVKPSIEAQSTQTQANRMIEDGIKNSSSANFKPIRMNEDGFKNSSSANFKPTSANFKPIKMIEDGIKNGSSANFKPASANFKPINKHLVGGGVIKEVNKNNTNHHHDYPDKVTQVLEKAFQNNSVLTNCVKGMLMKKTNLTANQLKIWFQNRRLKNGNEKVKPLNCTNVHTSTSHNKCVTNNCSSKTRKNLREAPPIPINKCQNPNKNECKNSLHIPATRNKEQMENKLQFATTKNHICDKCGGGIPFHIIPTRNNSKHVENNCKHVENNCKHVQNNCKHVKNNSKHVENNYKHVENNNKRSEIEKENVEPLSSTNDVNLSDEEELIVVDSPTKDKIKRFQVVEGDEIKNVEYISDDENDKQVVEDDKKKITENLSGENESTQERNDQFIILQIPDTLFGESRTMHIPYSPT